MVPRPNQVFGLSDCCFVCLMLVMFLTIVCVLVTGKFVVVFGVIIFVVARLRLFVYVSPGMAKFALVTHERSTIAWLRDLRSLCSASVEIINYVVSSQTGKGCALTVCDMAKLMGYDTNRLEIRCPENAFKHMLGMAVHRSTMGFALMSLIASLRSPVS